VVPGGLFSVYFQIQMLAPGWGAAGNVLRVCIRSGSSVWSVVVAPPRGSVVLKIRFVIQIRIEGTAAGAGGGREKGRLTATLLNSA